MHYINNKKLYLICLERNHLQRSNQIFPFYFVPHCAKEEKSAEKEAEEKEEEEDEGERTRHTLP